MLFMSATKTSPDGSETSPVGLLKSAVREPSIAPALPDPAKEVTVQSHGGCALSPATVHAVEGMHGAHAAVAFAKVPTGHVVDVYEQLIAPCALKPPGVQATHTDVEFAPSIELYVPAGHGRQVELQSAPAVVEYVPAGQAVHTEAPIVEEYVPAGQGVRLMEERGQ